MSLVNGLEKTAGLGTLVGSLARKGGSAAGKAVSTAAKVPAQAIQATMGSKPVQVALNATGMAARGVGEGLSFAGKGVHGVTSKVVDAATAGRIRKGIRQGFYRPGVLDPQKGSLGRDASSVGAGLASVRSSKVPAKLINGRSAGELEQLQSQIGQSARKDVFARANQMRAAKGLGPISEASLGPKKNDIIGGSVADRRIAKREAKGESLSRNDKSRIELAAQSDVVRRAKNMKQIRDGSWAARHPLMAGTGLALAGYNLFGGSSQAPPPPSVFNSQQ